ncbi:hypothetical protein GCM10010350_80700 [Streptomyces galilaeus]|nr:hypothetical protein GCM10010350_80700 [Streptomyces galilaeus]
MVEYPEEEDPAPDDVESTEVRLALVMNGGVSLAVWMAGVTHEIDLLRRASHVNPEVSERSVPDSEKTVFDIWKSLAKEARKNVRVDVISGTSAGGLNGMLLATAVARGAALNLRETWVQASLLELTPNPQAEKSILSGEKLEAMIGDSISGIGKGDRFPSETVTLFVTATALDGRSPSFSDSYGKCFDVRDHRRVYRFKSYPLDANPPRAWKYKQEDGVWSLHKADTLYQFADSFEPALKRAARATASFPIAFPPVSEELLMTHRIFPDPRHDFPASCVMDGGVLSNAPFGPVMDEITRRRISKRPVERIVAYIVPSAGNLADEKVKKGPCRVVPPGDVAMSALNYPQEVDFRSSADDLRNRLQTSVRETREHLFKRLVDGQDSLGDLRGSAEMLLGAYRRSRVKAVVTEVAPEQKSADSPTTLGPPPEVNDAVIAAIMSEEYRWFPPSTPVELEKPRFCEWRWGVITAERVLQTLGHYLLDMVKPSKSADLNLNIEQRTVLLKCARRLNHGLRGMLAVSEALRSELRKSISASGSLDPELVAKQVDNLFRSMQIPEVVGAHVRRACIDFNDALKAADLQVGAIRTDTQGKWESPESVISACLVVEVLTQAFAPPSKVVDRLTPKFQFMRLGPDELGPLFHEDWAANLGDRKLYGTRFRHFGAFISDERHDWRQSDFTWGRLDAAHHLLPLLRPDGVDDDWLREHEELLHQAILSAEAPPGRDGREWMRDHLEELDGKRDPELLDSHTKEYLNDVGEKAIGLLVKGRAAKRLTVFFWRRAFGIWCREKGRISLKEALEHALSLPKWPGRRS